MPRTFRRFFVIVTLITTSVFLGACSVNEDEPAAAPPTPQTASSPNKPASPYYGSIDSKDCDSVKGWVYNGTNPTEKINVALYVDGKLAETLPAETLRPDLVNKVGTARYGFSFKIPSAYKDGKPHTADVKVVGSEYSVPFYQGVPSSFECKPL